jgi:hypothetical protein
LIMSRHEMARNRRPDVLSLVRTEPRSNPSGTPQPESLRLLSSAARARLADPRLERERIELVAGALAAGHQASGALADWLSQALSEYRGSHSVWDLEETTARLRLRLAEFDRVLREHAARLQALLPPDDR